MRQWLNILAGLAFCLAAPAVTPATARPGMMSASHPAVAMRGAGKPAGRPGEPANANAQTPDRGFSNHKRTFAVAGGGYGYFGDYGVASDAPAAAGPRGEYAPLPFVLYQRPPQLTCFRPRLITIGARPRQATHLPKVVYGGPLPCGFKG